MVKHALVYNETTAVLLLRFVRLRAISTNVPMVALYWLENLLFTYRFINEVLPTPESPKMITFSKTFLREAMMYV